MSLAAPDLSLPPHDFDAEVSLIGNWMRSDPKWLARDHVPPEDFYDGTNAKAARVVLDVRSESTLVALGDADVVLGQMYAEKARELFGKGADAVLERLRLAMSGTGEWYGGGFWNAKIVREKAQKRGIHVATRQAIADLDGATDFDLVQRKLGLALERAQRSKGARLDGATSDQAAEAMAFLAQTQDELRDAGYLRWYVPKLDFRGLLIAPDDFVLVAARPGSGKTTFLRQWSVACAEDTGRPVVYLSYETGSTRIVADMLLSESGVGDPHGRGIGHEADARALHEAFDRVARVPVYVPPDPIRRLEDLVPWMRGIAFSHKPAAFVVDYLGLITAPGRSTYEMAGNTSRAMRQVALSCRVPVVAACQLNRASANDKREPAMHDLRDSGQLEQDAVSILFLHQHGPSESAVKNVRVLVGKARNAGAGHRVEMVLDGPRKTMREAHDER